MLPSKDNCLVGKVYEVGAKLIVNDDLQSLLNAIVSLVPGGEHFIAIKDIALGVEDTKAAILKAESNITSAIQNSSEKIIFKLSDMSSNLTLQPIIKAIVKIQGFKDDLGRLLSLNLDSSMVLQELEKYIKEYERTKPHQQISNHADQWKPQQLSYGAMSSLLDDEPKAWGTEYSRLLNTHVTERFFDCLAMKIAEGGAFWLKCYSVKEEIDKEKNHTDDKRFVALSIHENLLKIKNVKDRHVQEVRDRESLIFVERKSDLAVEKISQKNGLVILKCHIEKDGIKICTFKKDVNLSDESLPIIYKTKDKPHCDNVTFINFDNSCKLNFIPNSIFRIFNNLTSLNIESTGLDRLEPHFFHNAHMLQKLSIQNNNIKCIHARTFESAQSLTSVILKNNQIVHIHRNAFVGLSKLEWLILSKNKMENLSSDVFRPLTKLVYLDLKENPCINKMFTFTNYVDLTSLETELDSKKICY